MEITEDRIIISDAVSIDWNRIRSLKLLNRKLFVELPDAMTLEVGGLSASEIDRIFNAYSHYMMLHRTKA